MTTEELDKIENSTLFKLFLRAIWFHSFAEYKSMYENDIEGRIKAVDWFLEICQNYTI